MICRNLSLFTFVACTTILLFAILIGGEEPLKKIRKLSREGKRMMYLPFVKIIIPPEPCGSAEVGLNGQAVPGGVCLPLGKCEIMKGQRNGDCARGLGECCRFIEMCNASNSEIIVNKEVVEMRSGMMTDQCKFVFKREQNSKYCGIKLDFPLFMSQSANTDGTCLNDSLTIRGSSTVENFRTCGMLNGQHMYLAFGHGDRIEVIPSFSTAAQYRIVATQIPCFSPLRVPDWCFQYYNTTRGTVRSFDFGRQQQASQRYTICLGAGLSDGDEIMWMPGTNCGGNGVNGVPFHISDAKPGETVVCEENKSDWVQINGRSIMCSFDGAGIVKSSFKPYTLNVNFNEGELPQLRNIEDIFAIKSKMICEGTNTLPAWLQPLWFGCVFNDLKHRCECQPTLAHVESLPVPETNNTGFCLDYMIN